MPISSILCWQTFAANSGKGFFGTADFEPAKLISDSLGQFLPKLPSTGHRISELVAGESAGILSREPGIMPRSVLAPKALLAVIRYETSLCPSEAGGPAGGQ